MVRRSLQAAPLTHDDSIRGNDAELISWERSVNRARYYDPQNGRFLAEDRMGFDAGMNFYTYVGNDANDFADPFGNTQQKPFCCTVKLPTDADAALLSQLIFAEGTSGDGISAENSDKEMLAIASSVINRVDYTLDGWPVRPRRNGSPQT